MTEQKTALITGGSRGIGKACAIELAKAGYDIIINYAGNIEAANSTVEELKKLNVNAEAIKFDIADKAQVDESIKKLLEKYGKIDILVNNAGITRDGLFMRMTEENWNSVINTNLSGMYNVTQPISKSMLKNRAGSIVNLASVIGVSGNAGQANYAAAKAGVIGLTKSLAKEFGSRGVRVNAVAPGFISTDMTKDLDSSIVMDVIPLKRLGTPEDVAKVVKFLAVDAEYVTGQTLRIDGGLMI